MILTNERPAHSCRELAFVPSQDGAGYGAKLDAGIGLNAHHYFGAERRTVGLRALLKYPVMDERAEILIVEECAEPGEKAQPDVLQSRLHTIRQDQLSGCGNPRLSIVVKGDILPPEIK